MTALILGLLALALAGPLSAWLARWQGAHLTPGASLVLWQAVALAAVLSGVGAGLAAVTALTWQQQPTWLRMLGALVGVSVAGTVIVRLLVKGGQLRRDLTRTRRRHLEQLSLVSEPLDRRRPNTRVLPHGQPIAYCLPSARRSRIVVSDGALAKLAPGELEAVLAHEREHVVVRHDLLLEFFTVLGQAFPRWCSSRAALAQVQLLVELHADRAALRVATPKSLANALVTLSAAGVPEGAMAVGGAGLVRRIQVLGDLQSRPVQAGALMLAAWAVLVLPTFFVALPWLVSLA